MFLEAKETLPLPDFIYNGKPVDAKAISMGESFSAVSDNPSAAYWNPAGLKQLERNYFTFCSDINQETDASDTDLYKNDSLEGKKLLFLGFASPKGAVAFKPLSNYSGIFKNNEIEIRSNKYIFSFASRYTANMLMGINLNYISAQVGVISENSPNISDGNGFGIDIGLLYTASQFLKIGFLAENAPGYLWWTDYRRHIIKSHIRTGIAVQFAEWFLFSFDYENDASTKKEFYHAGLQQSITKHLFLRQGIISEKFFKNTDANSYTAGVGYELKNWIVDFATKFYKLDSPEKNQVIDYILSLTIPL